MGELMIFVRNDQGKQEAVVVPMMGTVGDVVKEAQSRGVVSGSSRLFYGGELLTDYDATLADLGICSQSVIETGQAAFSAFTFDGESATSSYTHPEKWTIQGEEELTILRNKGGGYTCNNKMKPKKRIEVISVLVKVDKCGQTDEYDSIGLICESQAGDVFCSRPQNTRLRFWSGEVFIDGRLAGEIEPAVEGSVIRIEFDPNTAEVFYQVGTAGIPGSEARVGGVWNYWKDTHADDEEGKITFAPAVQTRHENWQFTIMA
eukprot:Hpha_TRINITY_DN3381_c0_g1::TRINITY_DN3381_c0_g1_i2::g.172270::m.172270